jgi:galactokinase
MDLKGFKETFYYKYGNRDHKAALFFSPGRVNLIGEHTDYNGGFVFPCALNYGTYLMMRGRNDNRIRLSTLNFDEDAEVENTGLFVKSYPEWINYPLGVINEFLKKDLMTGGLDLLYYGDVPNAAGLSSSASIEMVTAVALNDMFSGGIDMAGLVRMSQRAENEFVGMNCGIMDQFASGFGRKDHAIFLNCDTLEFEHVPVRLGDCSLIITNTNKKRGLTDSKYNERRSECEKAVDLIQPYKPVKNLSKLTVEDIPSIEKYITDPVILKRARHIITENGRVLEAVRVLKENNIERFGHLMDQSHDSLMSDYEVTGTELDTLVYEARKLTGVIGSRMTGAGFGGCTVSIVKKANVEEFKRKLSLVYHRMTSLSAGFYEPLIGDGGKRLE